MYENIDKSMGSGNDNSQRHLVIRLLGTLAITMDDGTALELSNRKAQALFVYVAISPMPVPRSTLTLLFWPDMEEQTARNNLRSTLTILKRQLAPYLTITTTTVAFRRHLPYFLDVEEFCRHVDTAMATSNITPQHAAALQTAVALYQGEFLQGFELRNVEFFDEWLLQQRERLRLALMHALETLVTFSLVRGDYAAGLQAGHRLLTLEPWSESAHCQVMELLALSGERAKALRQYEHCRQLLAAELGVAPSFETTDLYQQIQDGRLGPHSRSQLPMPSPPQSMQPVTITPSPALPNNLHTPLTAFIGRQKEQARIIERLSTDACRLLSITGPGGIGKSSLALSVGRQLLGAAQNNFVDGIFWVPLADINVTTGQQSVAPVTDSASTNSAITNSAPMGEAILQAIADTLNTQPLVKISSISQLQVYVRTRALLLILDNLEHLVDGIGALVSLLAHAPNVKILATSRSRLQVRGETVLTLDTLSLPVSQPTSQPGSVPMGDSLTVPSPDLAKETQRTAGASWQESEAVAMFVQRAEQVVAEFTMDAATTDAVVRICRLVEGFPLAIELATSMLPQLSCQELAGELTETLAVLKADLRDMPPDQRTLAAVFDRSWRLLSGEHQRLLAYLSIFPASFSREAATMIADTSVTALRQLIHQSLVNQIGDGRYILHRTIYEFARQKLQQWPAQIAALEEKYSYYYLQFLAVQEQTIVGAEYTIAAEQIQADLHNIHRALRYSVAHRMYPLLHNCLVTLVLFYDQYGRYRDAYALFRETIAQIESNDEQRERAPATAADLVPAMTRLQILMAFCHIRLGESEEAYTAYQIAWDRLQHHYDPQTAALCASLWGASLRRADPQRSVALLFESQRLAKISNTAWIEAIAFQGLGETNLLLGNYAVAGEQIQMGYAIAEKLQWPRSLTTGQKALGLIAIMIGDYAGAETHFQNAMTIARQTQLQHLYLECILLLGAALSLQQRFAEAEAYFAESHTIAETFGMGVHFAPVLWEKGCLAEQRHEYDAAKALFTQSIEIGLPNWWAHALPTFGWVLIALGEHDEAKDYFQTVYTDAEAQERRPVSLEAQAGLLYIEAGRAAENSTLAAIGEDLRQICRHPAATQQTRDRIKRITARGLQKVQQADVQE